MESKSKWRKILVVVILILTNLATFMVATTFKLRTGDRLLINVDSDETAQGITKLLELKDEIGMEYYKEVNDNTLLEGAIKGMFDSLGDPYSTYFTPEEFREYMESSNGVYQGIGVVVTEDEQGVTYVIAPTKGTPADEAGVKTGDKFIKVDGEDVTTLGSDAVVSRVRGPVDTTVEVTFARGDELIEMQLVRKLIETQAVDSRMIGDKGYIQISGFSNKMGTHFVSQLNALLEQNPTGLVIDLRSNPGGSVSVAVAVADRLLGETMVVYTVDKNGNRSEYTSDAQEKLDLPMVVLVDGGSASAAEILAGALQDTGAAKLVGMKTFGKGVVQEIIALKDGGGFKVTNSEYFTPNGKNIHGAGLEPDVEIEISEFMMSNAFTDEEDVQLQKALEVLSETK